MLADERRWRQRVPLTGLRALLVFGLVALLAHRDGVGQPAVLDRPGLPPAAGQLDGRGVGRTPVCGDDRRLRAARLAADRDLGGGPAGRDRGHSPAGRVLAPGLLVAERRRVRGGGPVRSLGPASSAADQRRLGAVARNRADHRSGWAGRAYATGSPARSGAGCADHRGRYRAGDAVRQAGAGGAHAGSHLRSAARRRPGRSELAGGADRRDGTARRPSSRWRWPDGVGTASGCCASRSPASGCGSARPAT